MDFKIEVHCHESEEARMTSLVFQHDGRLQFREQPIASTGASEFVCLTYEFDTEPPAEAAAQLLRGEGKHVEGPVPYGP